MTDSEAAFEETTNEQPTESHMAVKWGDKWFPVWWMPSWDENDEPLWKAVNLGTIIGYATCAEAEAFIEGYDEGVEANR